MASHDSNPKPLIAAQPANGLAPANGLSTNGNASHGLAANGLAANGAMNHGVPTLADSAFIRSGYYPPGAVLAPDGNGGQGNGPTFSSLARAFRRRWPLALGAALVGALLVIALIFFLLMPPGYRATTWFQLTRVDDQDLNLVKSTQNALVKSPLVVRIALEEKTPAGIAVKDLPLVRGKSDPVGWLETALKIDFPAVDVMRVSLTGDDPEQTAALLNALAEALIKVNEDRDGTTRQKRIEQLKEKKGELDQQIDREQEDLDPKLIIHRRRETDLKRTREDMESVRKRNDENEVLLGITRGQLDSLKLYLKNLGKAEAIPIPTDKLDEYLGKDIRTAARLKDLQAQLDKAIANISETKRVAPAGSAEALIARFEAERKHILREVDELRETYRPEMEKRYRVAEVARAGTDLEKLTWEVQRLEAQGKRYLEQLHKAREMETTAAAALATPQALRDQQDIKNMEERLTTLKDVRKDMQKQITSMEKGVDRDPTKSRVLLQTEANPPSGKDISRQVKFAGAGGIGLFCLLLFGVTYLEFRSGKVGEAEEIAGTMSLVGTVPLLPAAARKPISAGGTPKEQYWQNRLSESIDGIRTLLLHVSRTDSLRVLMVTSASGGEGKTSLASQLAASLARAWRKVLLIDGDLRHPAVHGLFNLPLEPGFCEVLRGEVKPTDAIKPTPLSRLWTMPAGHWDSHAVQALAQDSVRSLLEQLKQQYDFIIIDACPVLPVADSLVLGQHVDGALFSVLRDVSRLPALQAAHQKMANLGIRTLGAVVIGTDAGFGPEGYKYAAAVPK